MRDIIIFKRRLDIASILMHAADIYSSKVLNVFNIGMLYYRHIGWLNCMLKYERKGRAEGEQRDQQEDEAEAPINSLVVQ